MDKIVCLNCKRKEDIIQYPYKNDQGNIIGNVFLCTICVSLIKECKISLAFDDEKVQKVKEAMKLAKKPKKRSGKNSLDKGK